MADKSKQHWQKAEERKKIKKQKEQAEIERFIRKVKISRLW